MSYHFRNHAMLPWLEPKDSGLILQLNRDALEKVVCRFLLLFQRMNAIAYRQTLRLQTPPFQLLRRCIPSACRLRIP